MPGTWDAIKFFWANRRFLTDLSADWQSATNWGARLLVVERALARYAPLTSTPVDDWLLAQIRGPYREMILTVLNSIDANHAITPHMLAAQLSAVDNGVPNPSRVADSLATLLHSLPPIDSAEPPPVGEPAPDETV